MSNNRKTISFRAVAANCRMRAHSDRLKWVAATLIVGVVISAAVSCKRTVTRYRDIESPDGKYRIVVYSRRQFFPVGPGQGGDASGFVQLQDRTGKVLREKEVAMVQNIDQVYWEQNKVEIKLFADWDLP